MRRKRLALFKERHFEAEMIVLCVRWYLRFGLSFQDLEEMMVERNLNVDHVTIWRWYSVTRRNWNRRWPSGAFTDELVLARGRDVYSGRGEMDLIYMGGCGFGWRHD